MNKKHKLLIFDCDGVLVDSEPLANRIFIECLQKEGFDLDEAYGLKFYGIPLPDCIKHVESEFQKKVPDQFVETLSLLTNEEIKKNLKAVRGVASALSQIQNPKCVASGSDYDRLRLSLEVTGLKKHFENIYSSSEVERGKPFPDIFLFAAEKMGFRAEDSVVIEDSQPGMQAGLSAGMKVFLYNPRHENNFPVPSEVISFHDMKDLPGLLSN